MHRQLIPPGTDGRVNKKLLAYLASSVSRRYGDKTLSVRYAFRVDGKTSRGGNGTCKTSTMYARVFALFVTSETISPRYVRPTYAAPFMPSAISAVPSGASACPRAFFRAPPLSHFSFSVSASVTSGILQLRIPARM